MTEPAYRLNMDMMIAIHDALRRDLVQVARISKLTDDSPGPLLRAVQGWEIFKKFLVIHHRAEDETIWPSALAHAEGNPDQVATVEAMEAEHNLIDPLLASIDEAAADPNYGYQQLGDRVDELVTALTTHLVHEEADGLAVVDALLAEEEWARFAKVQAGMVAEDRILYLPWLLEDATDRSVKFIEGSFPEQFIAAYRAKWGPAFAALDRWEPKTEPEA